MARYDHQKVAAEKLAAGLTPGGNYDVVMDAVGSSFSLARAVEWIKPPGAYWFGGDFLGGCGAGSGVLWEGT